jgi:hypothetical protein
MEEKMTPWEFLMWAIAGTLATAVFGFTILVLLALHETIKKRK